jgi:hypothetical protein
MYMLCRHIKANGFRCQSPALRGRELCYYHSKTHIIGAEPSANFGPLQLPTPEDSAAIQLSVARISDAIINGRIDLKKAASLLYGLQIAAQFADRKNSLSAPDAVKFAESDSQGQELAPQVLVCDPKNDHCSDCTYAEICPRTFDSKKKKN